MATDYVQASDGASEVQSALDETSSGDTVTVQGSGEYDWRESVDVPNNTTLDLGDIEYRIPANHNLSTDNHSGTRIWYFVTNKDRSNAEGVTIQGGDIDWSDFDEGEVPVAGTWLHRARNSEIRDHISRSAGERWTNTRCYSITSTASEDCQIVDSYGYDGGYDGIGIRGANRNIDVIRCGGSGDSGTIQAAPWGGWNIGSGGGRDILFKDCSGRRIYAHGTIGMEFDSCESHYRIQTLGARDVHIHGTRDFEGKVLLYTVRPNVSTSRGGTVVEDMTFAPGGRDLAIQIGVNGPDSGSITLRDLEIEREQFLWFRRYSRGGSINNIDIERVGFRGTGSSSSTITQESNIPRPESLSISNSVFVNAGTGIRGRYGSVTVRDTGFHAIEGDAIDVEADSVDTSGVVESDDPSAPIDVADVARPVQTRLPRQRGFPRARGEEIVRVIGQNNG